MTRVTTCTGRASGEYMGWKGKGEKVSLDRPRLSRRRRRLGRRIEDASSSDQRHRHPDVLDLIGRYGEVIAIDDHEIREPAALDRTQIIFAEEETRTARR